MVCLCLSVPLWSEPGLLASNAIYVSTVCTLPDILDIYLLSDPPPPPNNLLKQP